MSPTLRIEIFPADLNETIHFYTKVLAFTLIRHEPDLINSPALDRGRSETIDKGYAHMVNGSIHIGADASYTIDSPDFRRELRRPPIAVELIMEVGDLAEIRGRVEAHQWPVRSDEDINVHSWGLGDFRLEDPDGDFIRISEASTKGDGTGF